MFAVKGWNVQASALKTQTDVIPNIKATAKNGEGEKNKKRKRGEKGAATAQVTDGNVGDLWATTIEDKKPNKRERLRQKKQKLEAEGGAAKEGDGETDMIQKETIKEAAPAKPEAQADAEAEAPAEIKKKAKKGKKERLQEKAGGAAATTSTQGHKAAAKKAAAAAPPSIPVLPATAKLTPMQTAMRQKLVSARFRHLNETLYTAPSTTSLDLFSQNPEMFDDYHSGFRQQVTTWPENPLDSFVRMIRERGAVKGPKSQKSMFRDKKRGKNTEGDNTLAKGEELPRTHGTAIIADLGCGDGRLAQDLTESGDTDKLHLKIHSYDLQSPSKYVTKADVANLPLADGSVDIAIFCLALMGTNWIDFIEEAYRILHWKGELWIAEIKSRFGRVGGDGPKKSAPGRPVEHSVGSKRKLAQLKKKTEKASKVQDERAIDETLRTEVDEQPMPSREETDVNAFIEVLRRRGFVLKNENAVDMSNKMFVRFEFIKAAAAVVGKNVPAENAEDKKKPGETWQKKAKKFIENEKKEHDVSVGDEAKVLRPCLYKIR
ncbi:methyltransferase-domain-containing protein [Delphinella strobiligena]|nr:methyltransferase-domain-containing protein [Delphinella strobiligena]